MKNVSATKGNIIEELGLAHLPIEMQDRILSKFTENLIKQIGLKIFTVLPESERPEFEKVSAAGDIDAINNFLKSKIPNYEKVAEEETEKAKKEFKRLVEELG